MEEIWFAVAKKYQIDYQGNSKQEACQNFGITWTLCQGTEKMVFQLNAPFIQENFD